MSNSHTAPATRLYLTPQHQIGAFASVKKMLDGERYELRVNGESKLFRPDTLAEIPAEKLSMFKRLAK